MENIDGRIIILILFVVISAINWFIQKLKGPQPHEHEISESIEDLYEDFRDEIRQRQTRTVEQTERVSHTPAPAPPPLPQPTVSTVRQTPAPAQPSMWQKPHKATLSPEQQAAAARFQQHASRSRKPSAQSYVRELLSKPSSTRQAIILAEILGKPKSLQRG
jgi:type IV secretory pathway VirB10-like protein